jgi:hypothetical protein
MHEVMSSVEKTTPPTSVAARAPSCVRREASAQVRRSTPRAISRSVYERPTRRRCRSCTSELNRCRRGMRSADASPRCASCSDRLGA